MLFKSVLIIGVGFHYFFTLRIILNKPHQESSNVYLVGEHFPSTKLELFSKVLYRQQFIDFFEKSFGLVGFDTICKSVFVFEFFEDAYFTRKVVETNGRYAEH